MATLNPDDIALFVTAAIFILGISTFILGIFVLTGRALSKDINTLASQTSKLADKGIAEDISGLVGNTSALMDSLQQMVRTTAGIGIFLTLIGLLMMGVSLWLLTRTIGWPIS